MASLDDLAVPVDEPRKMVLCFPDTTRPMRDAEGNTGYVEVLSADSSVSRKVNRDIQQRRLNAMGAGRRTRTRAEELEAEAVDLLVALTVSWRLLAPNWDDPTGVCEVVDDPYSPEVARKVYSSGDWAWLRRQVDEFAAELGNFVRRSSVH